MARKSTKTVEGAEAPTELKMTGGETISAFTTSDGTEYELDGDGTCMIAAEHVAEAQSHGFVLVPGVRAAKAAK